MNSNEHAEPGRFRPENKKIRKRSRIEDSQGWSEAETLGNMQ
jgi:hypothetical protein